MCWKMVRLAILAALCFWFGKDLLHAQSGLGAVTGQISDSTGHSPEHTDKYSGFDFVKLTRHL
jgi:hypothetical protein